MKTVTTSDLYETAYYLLNGCELVEIEGNRVNGRIVCSLILSGELIAGLQLTYLNGEAEANILSLRRMVGQVSAWVHTAKRKFKNSSEGGPSAEGGTP